MVKVTAEEERSAIIDVLTLLGATSSEAEVQAHVLVEADLRGRRSHGIQRLPVLASRIELQLLRPRAELQISWPTPAVLTIDGSAGFGPYAAFEAVRLLATAAASTGIALAAIRNTSHIGMLAPYLEAITSRGLIGFAFTTSEALVHPAGGMKAMIGTNPIGIGVPVEGQDPFILDMSTGAISAGEIIAYAQRGESLPPGRAIDEDGRPTTDAEHALRGAISPFGGPKGYGLGLGLELVVAAMTQTALGEEVRGTLDIEHPATKGDLFLAMDPRTGGREGLGVRCPAYLQALKQSPAVPGSEGVIIPGDRARAERGRALREGVELPASVWLAVTQLRDRLREDAPRG